MKKQQYKQYSEEMKLQIMRESQQRLLHVTSEFRKMLKSYPLN